MGGGPLGNSSVCRGCRYISVPWSSVFLSGKCRHRLYEKRALATRCNLELLIGFLAIVLLKMGLNKSPHFYFWNPPIVDSFLYSSC